VLLFFLSSYLLNHCSGCSAGGCRKPRSANWTARKSDGGYPARSRHGQSGGAREICGREIRQEFEFESAQLGFVNPSGRELRVTVRSTQEREELEAQRKASPTFALRRDGQLFGFIRVKPHVPRFRRDDGRVGVFKRTTSIALDMCQLIEDKLQLERQLAERERLALVGQTAASISHNLKNPLGSIKTILQVQLENPEMPESMRGETKMVLDEISRLSTTESAPAV